MGGAEECSEEKAEACVDTLLSSILGDTTEEEVCKELRTSIDCLRSTVEECLGDEVDDEIEEGLQELEKVLNDNCKSEDSEDGKDDEDEEIQKCFEDNEDYIYECIYEGSTQALTLMIEKGDELDENVLQCTMYAMMSGCFVDRIGEKCGQKAAGIAEEEMNDLPEEIKEACEAAGEIETQSFQLLENKKRK